jgi:transposase
MRPGQIERRTHDYKRHGTTSLFAALDVKAGTVIGQCMPRHRAQEFRRFLDTVEKNVPRDLDIHVVMDNASSHKTKLIRDWFARRPRWHMLHADLRLLAEPGRALLRPAHRRPDQARRPPLHRRA